MDKRSGRSTKARQNQQLSNVESRDHKGHKRHEFKLQSGTYNLGPGACAIQVRETLPRKWADFRSNLYSQLDCMTASMASIVKSPDGSKFVHGLLAQYPELQNEQTLKKILKK